MGPQQSMFIRMSEEQSDLWLTPGEFWNRLKEEEETQKEIMSKGNKKPAINWANSIR